MPMYDLIEYSDNCSKTSGSLWQYYKDMPTVNNGGDIVSFNEDNATDLFNFKTKITSQTNDGGETNGVEIMVPLKYLSNFWRTLEMSLINSEIELILDWLVLTMQIYSYIHKNRDKSLVVTLSAQDNSKLLPELKNGFKRTITWNKYLIKPELLAQNVSLNHLVDPSFQRINRLFVLAFENDDQTTSNKRYYIPNVEIKDYNVMIDGKNFFDQPVRNDKVTYENIRKVAIGQGDDYTTVCLVDYTYFKRYYKMIAID